MKPKVIYLHVDKIIKSNQTLGALAELLSNEIKNRINENKKPLLIVLDFLKIKLLTYDFIDRSLKKYIKNNNNVLIIFRIQKYELEELITGLLDIFEPDKEELDSESEYSKLSNIYPIIYIDNKNNINFIANLNTEEILILDFINNKGKTTYNEISNYLISINKSEILEKITNILSKLHKIKFIYKSDETEPYNYCSINKILKDESKH